MNGLICFILAYNVHGNTLYCGVSFVISFSGTSVPITPSSLPARVCIQRYHTSHRVGQKTENTLASDTAAGHLKTAALAGEGVQCPWHCCCTFTGNEMK